MALSTSPFTYGIQVSRCSCSEGTGTDVEEIVEDSDCQCRSTASLLRYCQNKFLRPYSRLLAVIGLRRLVFESVERSQCHSLLGHLHLIQVVLFLLAGYILQALSCFRRDRGFDYFFQPKNSSINYYSICYGSSVYSYIAPSLLHFIAYLYAIYLFRIKDNEQLHNLMERVFLLFSGPSDGKISRSSLVRLMWIYIILSVLWMILSFATTVALINQGTINFYWLEHSSVRFKMFLKIVLVLTTLWHDIVQASVISSYCLQGQLLKSYLQLLKEDLFQHSIAPTEWMKGIREFRKLLWYFNEDLAPIVGIFTIVNITWAASGVLWFLHFDRIDNDTIPVSGLSVLNISLWTIIAIVPFLQAAQLTDECISTQTIGHEVRARPFVYRETSDDDLNSILIYTSTLKMSSKLCKVPIKGKYLYLALILSGITTLTLGQSHAL